MKNYHIGDHLLFMVNDFDSPYHEVPCIVTEVFDDHVLAFCAYETTLWIDDDTEYQFKKDSERRELNYDSIQFRHYQRH